MGALACIGPAQKIMMRVARSPSHWQVVARQVVRRGVVSMLVPPARCSTAGLQGRNSFQRNASTITTRRLTQLEQEADASPGDTHRQAMYLQALMQVDPSKGMRRFESGVFASNEECMREYIKGLVKTDR